VEGSPLKGTLKGTHHAFSTTSPAFHKYPFVAFRIRHSLSRPSGITTLYSGHDLSRFGGIANESLTLLVMMLSMISGKWKEP
jgi:hypothetical protein